MALLKCPDCSGPVSSDAKACPKCGAKPPRRTSLFTKIVGGLFALFVVSLVFSGNGNKGSTSPSVASPPAQNKPDVDAVIAQRCTAQRDAVLADVKKHMDAGQPWQAYSAVSPCANRMPNDEQYVALAKQTEIADYLKTIANKSATIDQQLQAHRRLASVDPQMAAPYAGELKRLEERALAEVKKEQQRIAAEKRKQGVSIGMTKEDVLASNWGKPERINTTTTARGAREQWVYGGRNYLYFDNDILTAVQN